MLPAAIDGTAPPHSNVQALEDTHGLHSSASVVQDADQIVIAAFTLSALYVNGTTAPNGMQPSQHALTSPRLTLLGLGAVSHER